MIEELLAEIKPSIASKEGIIADHEAQQILIQEKLSREYRILLISAVKGSQTDLPEYKDIFGTKDTNDSSFNSANFTRNNDLPPSLPPRPKSETVKLVKNPLVSIDPSLLEEFGSDPLHANIRNAQAPPLYSGDPGWTSGQQESSFEPSIDVNLKVDMDEHNSINAPIIHTLENQEIGLDSLRLDENPWN